MISRYWKIDKNHYVINDIISIIIPYVHMLSCIIRWKDIVPLVILCHMIFISVCVNRGFRVIEYYMITYTQQKKGLSCVYNIAKKSLNASTKEINEFLKNQEINQVNKKPTKHMNLKITALPKSFQIDMVYYPIGESS
jgi:hypothetical protein